MLPMVHTVWWWGGVVWQDGKSGKAQAMEWVEWVADRVSKAEASKTLPPAMARRMSERRLRPASITGTSDSSADDAATFDHALCAVLAAEEESALGSDWANWLVENGKRRSHELLYSLLDTRPELFPVVRKRWQIEVGATKHFIWSRSGKDGNDDEDGEEEEEEDLGPPWVEPNRHCTLMFYLNEAQEGGGETTFPLAPTQALASAEHSELELGQGGVDHPGMPECAQGLRVKPVKGGGALFYHKLGNGTNDPLSSHGGCPPKEGGVAWKINGFMWNLDTHQGQRYFQ